MISAFVIRLVDRNRPEFSERRVLHVPMILRQQERSEAGNYIVRMLDSLIISPGRR